MKRYPITCKYFSEDAILIEWPDIISKDILRDIITYKALLETKLHASLEFVPAYNSLTIISPNPKLEFNTLKKELIALYQEKRNTSSIAQVCWELPVCYDLEFGIDIEEVAAKLKLTIAELIEAHTSNEYTVYGIGFLPGFMYLGGLPEYMETKRKGIPRLHVSKGSVGLAGKQTGIYPQDSPGGWNIIGNCPIPIFDVNAKEPCFVSVGDKIIFKSITSAEYKLHKIEGEVGIYKPKRIRLNA